MSDRTRGSILQDNTDLENQADIVLAEWWSDGSARPAPREDRAVAQRWQPSRSPDPVRSLRLSDASLKRHRALIRRFERETRADIERLLRATESPVRSSAFAMDLPLPVSPTLAQLRAALDALCAAGALDPEEARQTQERLMTLGEASARLASVLHLHQTGLMPADELRTKRESIAEVVRNVPEGVRAARKRNERATINK